METHRGDGGFDGKAEETVRGESPEVGYGMWEFNMGRRTCRVSAVEDSALEEVTMTTGAERD